MIRSSTIAVSAVFVLGLSVAACSSHGGSSPSALPPAQKLSAPQASATQYPNTLPPQSPWRFWNVPRAGNALAQDKSHHTWFFSSDTSISEITLSGIVTTLTVPSSGTVFSLVYGNDGALWFSTSTSIGRISSTGSYSSYDINLPIGVPVSLTPGFGDDVWFTDSQRGGFIGHLTSDGTITTYQQTADFSDYTPTGITRGPDGNIWFDGGEEHVPFAGLIGRVDPATGELTERQRPADVGLFDGIVSGPDKRLWMEGHVPGGQSYTDVLLATDTNFNSTVYPLASYFEGGLVAGRDAIYVSAFVANTGYAILRVSTNGDVTTYLAPSQIACCSALSASGPDHDVWFSGFGTSGLGVLRAK